MASQQYKLNILLKAKMQFKLRMNEKKKSETELTAGVLERKKEKDPKHILA